MKILIDNCVDWRVRRLFPQHEVSHTMDLGWQRLENGKLLAAAGDAGFEVMITIDKKIRNQQNLDKLPVTVFEIDSPDSRLPEVQRLAPFIIAALPECRRYRFVSIDREGRIERLGERGSNPAA